MEITTINVPVTLREYGRKDLDFITSMENKLEKPFNVHDNLYYNGSWYNAYIIETKIGDQSIRLGYIIVHAVKNGEELEYFIERVFVIPEYRNQGLATHALKAAFIKMQELNFTVIKVIKTPEVQNNAELILILINLGFDQEDGVYFLRKESIC